MKSNNSSGYLGVKKTPSGKYVPTFSHISYGTYETPEEAYEVYKEQRNKLRVKCKAIQ